MVGIDLYVNETLAHCDYVLPAATMYERDDFPLPFQTLQPTPFRQATEAVIAPVGQARAEWEIIDDLTSRLWRRTPGLAMLAGRTKDFVALRCSAELHAYSSTPSSGWARAATGSGCVAAGCRSPV